MKIFNYLKSFNIIGIILWLLMAVVIFFILKRVWRFVAPILGLNTKTPLSDLTDSDKNDIAKASSQFLNSGNYTYRSGAEFLYRQMYGSVDGLTTIFPWLKTTDKPAVGNFLLNVLPSEYHLLSTVYSMLKDEKHSAFVQGFTNDDLSEDLRDLFNASEETKYLSHLKSVF